MTIFDMEDEEILTQSGWHPKKDITYKNCKKDELIDIIRCLEHNWAGAEKSLKLQNKRLENFCNYFKYIGKSELFMEICDKGIDKK